MTVIVILVCFFLSAFFHQGLYIIIPILSFLHISLKKQAILTLNPISKTYAYVVFFCLCFVAIQTLLFFELNMFSLKGCLRFVAYFFFAVLVSYTTIDNIKKVFMLIALYFLITLPMSFFQVYLDWNWGRYKNIFEHSNHLAYVLTMCIYFMVFHNPFKKMYLYIVILFTLFLSLLLTKSTGGLLVVLTLVLYNAIKTKKVSFIKKTVFFTILLLLALLVINSSDKISEQISSIDFLTWEFIKDRVDIYTIDGVNRAGGYGSFVWRIIYWSKLIFTFFSESFFTMLFGLGVDHLTKGYLPYEFMDKDPHNDFVKVLLEYGVLGVILFLGFFKRIYKFTCKNFNIVIMAAIPMFFGNAIVNYPFNITLILILIYEYKKCHSKIN
ncbi:hypothetical protein GCM10022271_06690 [Corallibacter vietnamensis]|uniref:O-antigen ligase-related domain-containing protein n=1 Tax=Corallibacter vietnamensis TaxID=904130 RepID=A0ABP7GYU8_9FLAO